MPKIRKDLDWNKIRLEYEFGARESDLCNKYAIPFSTLGNRIKRHNWKQRKEQTQLEISEKVTKTIIANLESKQEEAIKHQYETSSKLVDIAYNKLIEAIEDGDAKLINSLTKVYTDAVQKQRQAISLPDKIVESKSISVNQNTSPSVEKELALMWGDMSADVNATKTIRSSS